jgi:hypothetical protein
MPNKHIVRTRKPASCNRKLVEIRKILRSRTPETLATAEIKYILGIGKKPGWSYYKGQYGRR